MLQFLKDNNNDDQDIKNLLSSLKSDEIILNEDVVNENKDENSDTLFDIKKLNDLDDKMIRGTAKKIYMSGKRLGKTSSEIIEEIKVSIIDNGKMNEEIKKLLEDIL